MQLLFRQPPDIAEFMYIIVPAKSCTENNLIQHLSRNEVATGQLQVYDGWEFSEESYNARRSMCLLIKRMDIHIPTYN